MVYGTPQLDRRSHGPAARAHDGAGVSLYTMHAPPSPPLPSVVDDQTHGERVDDDRARLEHASDLRVCGSDVQLHEWVLHGIR